MTESHEGQLETATFMRPTTVIRAVSMAAIVVALGLYVAGAIGSTLYWFVLWLISATGTVAALRQARRYERMLDDADRLLRSITQNTVHSVRCAGCRTAAILARGALPDATDTVPLPPGWEMSHDRPYCGACIARAKARAN